MPKVQRLSREAETASLPTGDITISNMCPPRRLAAALKGVIAADEEEAARLGLSLREYLIELRTHRDMRRNLSEEN